MSEVSERVRVCPREELRPGLVKVVALGKDRHGLPREGLVLIDGRGDARCWVNLCKHLPIPIDGGSREFFDEHGAHLFCGTHGAKFRLHDGYCIEGPCSGDALDAVEVLEEDGVVYVVPPPVGD